MSKNISEEIKKEIINYYLSYPMSIQNVCKKYNLCSPTISKILKDIPKYSKARINNPNMEEDYFHNINSEEKAYFLGLILTDGNVFKSDDGRQYSISLSLKSEDVYILERFKQAIKCNNSITSDGRGCCQIAVRSNLMANDLKKYGIVPRKSLISYLPKMPDEYMSHFIRGIFDGDGSILAKPSPKQDGRNRFLHCISFCGTHELMAGISDYIFKTLNLKQKSKVYDYTDRYLSEIKIQNIDDIAKFGYWVYKDASIFLKRKQIIFHKFLNHYNLKNIETFKKEYECIWENVI